MKYSKAEYHREDGGIGPRDYELCMELGISPKSYHSFVENWEEDENGCLVWTKGTLTHGKIKMFTYGQKKWFNFHTRKFSSYSTHRLRLTFKLGRQPKPGYVAGHHCDNTLCGRHVSEITYSQNNSLDKIRDGTVEDTVRGSKQGISKLTEKEVKVIWERIQNGEGIRSIAKDYPIVHETTISDIKHGVTWNHVTGLPRTNKALVRLRGKKVSEQFMVGSLVKVVNFNGPSMTVTGNVTDYGYLECQLPYGGYRFFAPKSLIQDKRWKERKK